MKRIIFILTCLFFITTTITAKTRYIGYYGIRTLEYSLNSDTVRTESCEPIYNIANADSSFIIQIVCEDDSDEKSKLIKNAKFWAGFSEVTTVIGYAGAIYHSTASNYNFTSLGNNIKGFIGSYRMAKIGEISTDILLQVARDNENMAIGVAFVNNSPNEISLASNGYIWFIKPYSTLVTHGQNLMDMSLRVQYDLNNANSIEYFDVYVETFIEKEYNVKEHDGHFYYTKMIPCKRDDPNAEWDVAEQKYMVLKYIKLNIQTRKFEFISKKEYYSIK